MAVPEGTLVAVPIERAASSTSRAFFSIVLPLDVAFVPLCAANGSIVLLQVLLYSLFLHNRNALLYFSMSAHNSPPVRHFNAKGLTHEPNSLVGQSNTMVSRCFGDSHVDFRLRAGITPAGLNDRSLHKFAAVQLQTKPATWALPNFIDESPLQIVKQ